MIKQYIRQKELEADAARETEARAEERVKREGYSNRVFELGKSAVSKAVSIGRRDLEWHGPYLCFVSTPWVSTSVGQVQVKAKEKNVGGKQAPRMITESIEVLLKVGDSTIPYATAITDKPLSSPTDHRIHKEGYREEIDLEVVSLVDEVNVAMDALAQ